MLDNDVPHHRIRKAIKMKNIYIIGVPRTGKSTLSKLIKEKYPIYNQLSFEAIRNGFIESQPDLNMGNRNSEARSDILPKFITTVASWNNKILLAPTLIEGDFCSAPKLLSLLDENDLIICLGHGGRNIDEILKGIRENDTNADYTKSWSEEKIKQHFYDIVKNDNLNYDYCIKNNIRYYDTYINRKEVFMQILNDIGNI